VRLSTPRIALCLGLAVLIAVPSLSRAAGSPLAEVPAVLAHPDLPWSARRAQLAGIGDALTRRAIAHNGACGAVPSDDQGRVQTCAQEQAALTAEISAYHREVEAFNQGMAEALRAAPPAPVIGVAAAVRGDVFILGDDGLNRRVVNGRPVNLNGRLTTGPTGHVQLLLFDQTTFTIGPNSDMFLDKFVYDPDTGLGTCTAQFAKGFFRLVTAKIAQARPESVKIQLRSAVLGIRGTDIAVSVAADGSALIKLYSGAAVVRPANGGPEIPLAAGQLLRLTGDGSPGPLEPIG